MVLADIIERLKANSGALKAQGVEHVALFGSRARGDFRPESDLDALLDAPRGSGFSLLNLIGVEHLNSDLTGLKANAVMERSLDEDFRANISPEVVEVF